VPLPERMDQSLALRKQISCDLPTPGAPTKMILRDISNWTRQKSYETYRAAFASFMMMCFERSVLSSELLGHARGVVDIEDTSALRLAHVNIRWPSVVR